MANPHRSAEKEEFWRLVLSEFEQSGQSVREFCASQTLSEASFYSWRREIARRDAESQSGNSPLSGLLPVKVVDSSDAPGAGVSPQAPGHPAIEIVTPAGMTLRFDNSIDVQRLQAVVQAVALAAAGASPC